jgi:hypothetical protein
MTVNDLKTAVERHLDLVFAGVIAEPEPRRTRKSRKELQ